jgi:hypothetical protein
MILFVLTQRAPLPILLLLAIMVYLAVIEVRNREDMSFQAKVWWVMLVFLANFPGLIALRIYTFWLNRRRSAEAKPKT